MSAKGGQQKGGNKGPEMIMNLGDTKPVTENAYVQKVRDGEFIDLVPPKFKNEDYNKMKGDKSKCMITVAMTDIFVPNISSDNEQQKEMAIESVSFVKKHLEGKNVKVTFYTCKYFPISANFEGKPMVVIKVSMGDSFNMRMVKEGMASPAPPHLQITGYVDKYKKAFDKVHEVGKGPFGKMTPKKQEEKFLQEQQLAWRVLFSFLAGSVGAALGFAGSWFSIIPLLLMFYVAISPYWNAIKRSKNSQKQQKR